MKKNKITKRLSLRAKFKSTSEVEVVIMDESNNIQIELIPIRLPKTGVVEVEDSTDDESKDESGVTK